MSVFLTNKTAFLFNHSLAFVAAKVNIKEAELLLQAGALAVPVIKKYAEQDTITTLEILENLNVETGKILIVFNRVESDVDDEFFTLLNFMEKNNITIKTQAAIFENELFDELAIKKMTVEQLLDDPTDYKSLLRENREADPRQRDHWADMFGLKCLAKHVKKNLDDCFAELPPLRP